MPLTIRAALKPTSSLIEHVRPGIQAMKSRDQALIQVTERNKIGDSLDLDGATAAAAPQDHRWDYILSVPSAEKLVAVEPHSATNSEVSVVIRKKNRALAVLRDHLKPGQGVAEWHWVTHGRVAFSPMDRATRKLAQEGIQFHGRGLRTL